jgi:hypothetical protein
MKEIKMHGGKTDVPVLGDSPVMAPNQRVLGSDEDVTAVRQQHRNVFAERCRLAGLRCPDADTMLSWWPGTKAVFG